MKGPLFLMVTVPHHCEPLYEFLVTANVLQEPPPRVQFLKFGDYSLDFRLLVWTNQPRRHVQIRSDINYRIAELFRERGIKIPYPTQEFLLRGINLPRGVEPSLLADNDLDYDEERAGRGD